MRLFQQTLQSVLQLYLVAGQLVLSAHYGAPQSLFGIGHKAQGQLLGHEPFYQSFRIGEILLPPLRPAIGLRLGSAPDIGPAPSRFWQVGFQYRSSAPQTGFQYCAVDSITTSSTACSTNHSDSNRRWSGVVPNWHLSNWYSLSPSTSATTTANIFL